MVHQIKKPKAHSRSWALDDWSLASVLRHGAAMILIPIINIIGNGCSSINILRASRHVSILRVTPEQRSRQGGCAMICLCDMR